MENTGKLYESDSYLATFTAMVTSCEKKEDRFLIALDQTAFFPEGGGQTADRGRLGEAEVFDVMIRDGVIWHLSDRMLPEGERVQGKIDFAERFDKMQQHTGEHLVSGLVALHFGYDNVGFHLGSEEVTMDFGGPLSWEEIEKIEYLANQAVYANVPVTAAYPEPEKLKSMDYRSKLELEEDVRIVTINGYDVCACCAPHVKNTGEIGQIKITGVQRYKNGTRVSMLCGNRALAVAVKNSHIVRGVSNRLSVKPEQTEAAVIRLQEETAALKEKLTGLWRRELDQKVQLLEPGARHVCFFEKELTADLMRYLINQTVEICCGAAAVFTGDDSTGYRYVMAGRDLDIRQFSKELHGQLGGRGGGKPEMVQGMIPAREQEIRAYFESRE